MQNESTDVAVICGHADLVQNLTARMAASDYKYNMMLATQVADPEFRIKMANAGLSVADYAMMPTQWYRSDKWQERDPLTGWSTRDFITAYLIEYASMPTYHAASAAASGIALSLAIQAAGGIADMEAVAREMYKLNINTFYGPIKFSENGAFDGRPMLTLQNLPNMTVKVVAPPEMQEADLIYPQPNMTLSPQPRSAADRAPWPLKMLLLLLLAWAN